MLRKIRSLFFFLFFPLVSNAQQWLGISGSNYAGTNSVYNNPANLADSRYKLYVNLVGNDLFFANNYVGWNAPYSPFQLFTNTAADEYRNSKKVIIFKNAYYDINTGGGPFHANLLDDLRGPSALFTINDKHSVGLLTRVRTILNFNGVSEPLAEAIRLGTDTSSLKNQLFKLSETSLNINSYAEVGLSYGRVLKDDDEDFIKVGITVKRVIGLYSSHINIQEADYEIVNDPTDLALPPKRKKQILNINTLKADFGYTTEGAYKNANLSPSWALGNQSAGAGWGVDVGIVYEYRPDNRKYTYRNKGVARLDASKNKYEFRVGIALLDIGGISYNNPNYVRNWEVDVKNKTFNSADVSMINGSDDAYKRINDVIGLSDLNSQSDFITGLPSSFQINMDYHFRDKFYVNSLWVQGLRGSQSTSMKMPSSLSITPRWEGKWFEVAMPFVLFDNYNAFSFGIGGRIGPLFLGTDNLGSILNINHPRSTDIYFGLSLPIFRKPPTLPNACFYEKTERKGWRFWKK
ncbi:MAG: DUF5723 family protein [Arcicella sp.]|nr:DUF5723 family protein [Arcicella sp.]